MTYYTVELCQGDFSEIWYTGIFITDKEYKAKFYCSRANAILNKYKKYYEGLAKNTEVNNYTHRLKRLQFVDGIFIYSPIEIRTEFKGI